MLNTSDVKNNTSKRLRCEFGRSSMTLASKELLLFEVVDERRLQLVYLYKILSLITLLD